MNRPLTLSPQSLRTELTAAPIRVGGYIDGSFVAGDAATLPIHDPYTSAKIAELVPDDAAAVARAAAAARRSFDAGDWSRAPVAERQKVLREMGAIIRANAEELAILESLNTGIPISTTRSFHAGRASSNFDFFAEYVGQQRFDLYLQESDLITTVRHEPLGVCGLIGPWNMPLGLTSMKMAGALAFGNSCVVKPSEMTPLSVWRFFQLVDQAGLLPPGVINLVNGPGTVTGAALSAEPLIDMISFTGGTATGAAIMTALAGGIKRSAMELGGKSANIVMADADLDRAVDGAMLLAYFNNGQMCLAGSRLLLHESIAEEFLTRFRQRIAALRVGDPLEATTEFGPLLNPAQTRRMAAYVESGLAEGAELLAGGKEREGIFLPTLMRASANSLKICQEEIFGPFATVLTFKDDAEAVQIANDSDFGLVTYLWTRDIDRANRLPALFRSGSVYVNSPIVRDLRAGFGGYKMSGTGRESGDGCRDMFTEAKTVITAIGDRPFPRLGVAP